MVATPVSMDRMLKEIAKFEKPPSERTNPWGRRCASVIIVLKLAH